MEKRSCFFRHLCVGLSLKKLYYPRFGAAFIAYFTVTPSQGWSPVCTKSCLHIWRSRFKCESLTVCQLTGSGEHSEITHFQRAGFVCEAGEYDGSQMSCQWGGSSWWGRQQRGRGSYQRKKSAMCNSPSSPHNKEQFSLWLVSLLTSISIIPSIVFWGFFSDIQKPF